MTDARFTRQEALAASIEQVVAWATDPTLTNREAMLLRVAALRFWSTPAMKQASYAPMLLLAGNPNLSVETITSITSAFAERLSASGLKWLRALLEAWASNPAIELAWLAQELRHASYLGLLFETVRKHQVNFANDADWLILHPEVVPFVAEQVRACYPFFADDSTTSWIDSVVSRLVEKPRHNGRWIDLYEALAAPLLSLGGDDLQRLALGSLLLQRVYERTRPKKEELSLSRRMTPLLDLRTTPAFFRVILGHAPAL